MVQVTEMIQVPEMVQAPEKVQTSEMFLAYILVLHIIFPAQQHQWVCLPTAHPPPDMSMAHTSFSLHTYLFSGPQTRATCAPQRRLKGQTGSGPRDFTFSSEKVVLESSWEGQHNLTCFRRKFYQEWS